MKLFKLNSVTQNRLAGGLPSTTITSELSFYISCVWFLVVHRKKEIKQNADGWRPFLQSSVWCLSYFCRWVALFFVKLFVAFKLFLQMGCPLFAELFVALKHFFCRWVALFLQGSLWH